MDLKYPELKAEYQGFEKDVIKIVLDADKKEILNYYISAVLSIWGSNILYSPDYTTLLNEITGNHYTVEQTVTAMGCCGDPERKLIVPEFFKSCVQYDLKNETNESSKLIITLNDILVAAAMINGDFTVEETNCLSSILSSLIDYAYSQKLFIEDKPDNTSKVTGKKLETYLQNDALMEAARKKATPLESEKTSASSAPINITLNTINLTGSTIAPESSEKIETGKEESPIVSAPKDNEEETMESNALSVIQ